MKQELLFFENKIDTFTLPELEHINSVKEFNKFTTINTSISGELNKFYQKEYNLYNPMFPLQNAIDAEIDGVRMKCFIVDFNDDLVLVTFRAVFMNARVDVIDIPISLHGIESYRIMVLDVLKKKRFIHFLYKEPYRKFFKENKLEDMWCDFYYDFEIENEKHFTNGKWLRKRKVNLFGLPGSDFTSRLLERNDYTEMVRLRKEWCLGMKLNNNRALNQFVKSLDVSNDFIHYGLFFRKKLISVSSSIICENYAIRVFLTHCGRNLNTYTGQEKTVFTHLEQCMRFCEGKYMLGLGVKRLYISGHRMTNNTLLAEKEKVTNGFVPYYSDSNKGEKNV